MARRKRPQNLKDQESNSPEPTQEDPLDTFEETQEEQSAPSEEEPRVEEPTPEPPKVEEVPEPTPEPIVKEEKQEAPKENLNMFFNQMIPHLQVALICDEENHSKSLEMEKILKRAHIKVKRLGSTIGDPAVANLFRQCTAVIVQHKEKFEHFKRRAHASGRPVIVVTSSDSPEDNVYTTELRGLVSLVMGCKKITNSRLNVKNIRIKVLGF